MARFNQAPVSFPTRVVKQFASHPDATTNEAGGLAFKRNPFAELVALLSSTFAGEKKYYVSGTEELQRLETLVASVAETDAEFVLGAAAYARQVRNMRGMPVAVLAIAAALPAFKGNNLIRRWTPGIVRRPDELGEVVAHWISIHGPIGDEGTKGGTHAFPNNLKKGLAAAFAQFNGYSLLKYNGENRAVRLRDVLRICHVKGGSAELNAVFRYLIDGTFQPGVSPMLDARAALFAKTVLDEEAHPLIARAGATWENVLSHFGSKAEVWDAVAPQMGFMAILRNLRNFLKAGAHKAIDRAVKLFRDEKEVLNSKQLPFRFLSAYEVIEREVDVTHPRRREVLSAIETAVKLSVRSLPRLNGTTAIITDNSQSMDQKTSDKSARTCKEIGTLFGALSCLLSERGYTIVFAERAELVDLSPEDGVITNARKLNAMKVGGYTYAYKAVRLLREKKIRVDRIVLFSDMQCYTNRWADGRGGETLAAELAMYRREVGPARLISVDLVGAETAQTPQDDPLTTFVSGWSLDTLMQACSPATGSKQQGANHVEIEAVREWMKLGPLQNTPSGNTQDGDSDDADES